MTLPSSQQGLQGCKTRRLRFQTCCFWIFALPVVIFTIQINLSVINLDLQGSASTSGLSETISWEPLTDHETSHSLMRNKTTQPLIDILRYAKVNLSQKELAGLPKWSEVVARFGDSPRILGLESCPIFRQANPIKNLRLLAPAGIFNSGTNLLYRLLAKNCRTSDFNQNSYSKTGIDWQVNWGKHQSPRFRHQNTVKQNRNVSTILPVVVIRDPWTWLQSMCIQNYAAIWYHVVGPEGHCPNLVPNDVERQWFDKQRPDVAKYFRNDKSKVLHVLLKANFTLDMKSVPLNVRYKNEVARHESLAHFWKSWYHEYYNVNFPRLMIRLEDLVFHPYKTLQSICDCVEGSFASEKDFSLVATSVKNVASAAHSKTRKTDLVSSFFLHLRSNRTQGMTVEDLEFSRNVLDDSIVRQFFRYHPPTV